MDSVKHKADGGGERFWLLSLPSGLLFTDFLHNGEADGVLGWRSLVLVTA